MQLLGIMNGDLEIIEQLQIRFCICQMLGKKWEHSGTVHQLFVEFKKVYAAVRREVPYSILTEFGIPMKQVNLIKMYLY
jgi:hypothetical protein